MEDEEYGKRFGWQKTIMMTSWACLHVLARGGEFRAVVRHQSARDGGLSTQIAYSSVFATASVGWACESAGQT